VIISKLNYNPKVLLLNNKYNFFKNIVKFQVKVGKFLLDIQILKFYKMIVPAIFNIK
jgi:hypothetical protein